MMFTMRLKSCSCSESSVGNDRALSVRAGHETKVQRNSLAVPSKRSHLERRVDVVMLPLFLTLLVLCVLTAIFLAIFTSRHGEDMWYLEPEDITEDFDPDNIVLVFFTSFVTSFILYGYLIPISLYVTLEITKV